MNVIAEGHVALVERLDRMEHRFDGLEMQFHGLETRFKGLATKVDGLELFAGDAQWRLKGIEAHLHLNGSSGSSPRRKATKKATSAAPAKQRNQP